MINRHIFSGFLKLHCFRLAFALTVNARMHGQSAATAHAMCMNAWASIMCIAAVAHLVRCTSYHVILTLTDNTEAYALSISNCAVVLVCLNLRAGTRFSKSSSSSLKERPFVSLFVRTLGYTAEVVTHGTKKKTKTRPMKQVPA